MHAGALAFALVYALTRCNAFSACACAYAFASRVVYGSLFIAGNADIRRYRVRHARAARWYWRYARSPLSFFAPRCQQQLVARMRVRSSRFLTRDYLVAYTGIRLTFTYSALMDYWPRPTGFTVARTRLTT